MLCMNLMSKGLLMKPARSPSSWWLRPPEPIMTTFLSGPQAATASPIALPSAMQRLTLGSGNCTVLMQTGTAGGASPSGQNNFSGIVKAWSTSISWQVTMSNSRSIRLLMIAQERSGTPLKGGRVGMPQPSSSLRYSGAAPMAKVGILSRKKLRP